jgi:hypothetical protein
MSEEALNVLEQSVRVNDRLLRRHVSQDVPEGRAAFADLNGTVKYLVDMPGDIWYERDMDPDAEIQGHLKKVYLYDSEIAIVKVPDAGVPEDLLRTYLTFRTTKMTSKTLEVHWISERPPLPATMDVIERTWFRMNPDAEFHVWTPSARDLWHPRFHCHDLEDLRLMVQDFPNADVIFCDFLERKHEAYDLMKAMLLVSWKGPRVYCDLDRCICVAPLTTFCPTSGSVLPCEGHWMHRDIGDYFGYYDGFSPSLKSHVLKMTMSYGSLDVLSSRIPGILHEGARFLLSMILSILESDQDDPVIRILEFLRYLDPLENLPPLLKSYMTSRRELYDLYIDMYRFAVGPGNHGAIFASVYKTWYDPESNVPGLRSFWERIEKSEHRDSVLRDFTVAMDNIKNYDLTDIICGVRRAYTNLGGYVSKIADPGHDVYLLRHCSIDPSPGKYVEFKFDSFVKRVMDTA